MHAQWGMQHPPLLTGESGAAGATLEATHDVLAYGRVPQHTGQLLGTWCVVWGPLCMEVASQEAVRVSSLSSMAGTAYAVLDKLWEPFEGSQGWLHTL